MTSAESTLLGIVVGATLAWIANAFSSHVQWQREGRRAQRNRQREHWTALYQDMLKRTRALERRRVQYDSTEAPSLPSPEEIAEFDDWAVRVALFASPDVSELWDGWVELYNSCSRLGRRGPKTEAAQKRHLELIERQHDAHTAMVAQMRKELEK